MMCSLIKQDKTKNGALAHHTRDLSAAGIQNGLEPFIQTDARLQRSVGQIAPRRVLERIQIQRLRLGGQHIAGRGRPHARQQKQNRQAHQYSSSMYLCFMHIHLFHPSL